MMHFAEQQATRETVSNDRCVLFEKSSKHH